MPLVPTSMPMKRLMPWMVRVRAVRGEKVEPKTKGRDEMRWHSVPALVLLSTRATRRQCLKPRFGTLIGSVIRLAVTVVIVRNASVMIACVRFGIVVAGRSALVLFARQ